MSVKLERLEEANKAKLTIEVPADEFEEALQAAYEKQRKDISMPGFRKGKVPRVMIEKTYGPQVFYEEAANIIMPLAYEDALKEIEEEVVSRPVIDFEQIEKGKSFIFTAEVYLKPDVELGKYEGVTVTKIDTSVSEDEINDRLQAELDKSVRMVEVEEGTETALGDTVVIDFHGFIDDEPFVGGNAENYSLDLGSNSFIPGFEDQLVGKKAGDDVDVNVTFPEDYHAEDLAGKEAVFKCKIHEIKRKEYPALDDEFAQDISEFDTLEELKASYRAELEKNKTENAKQTQIGEALDKIAAKSKMDIPECMIDSRVDDLMNQFTMQLAQNGLAIDQYMQYTGQTAEDFKAEMRPNAEKSVKADLILSKIVEVQGIECTEEDLDAELTKMAEQYQLGLEQLKGFMGENEKAAMLHDVATSKAAEYIYDNAKFRAAPKKKSEEATEEEAE